MIDIKDDLEIVIVSGLSGSGKSVAIRALEDIGYFCIDNLPIVLFKELTNLFTSKTPYFKKIALVMDTRDPSLVEQGLPEFENILIEGMKVKIIFLECSNEVLVRRFKETRRTHPMAQDGSIMSGIENEREKLENIRKVADIRVDTSDLNIHQLVSRIQELFTGEGNRPLFHLVLLSFGFKYGLPYDADIVMDVRFLPNPYWVKNLRYKNGKQEEVRNYIFQCEEADQFLQRFSELLHFLLPFYNKEGKHYLTVAIGCTGGKHRSVAMTEALAQKVKNDDLRISVNHRDIKKDLQQKKEA